MFRLGKPAEMRGNLASRKVSPPGLRHYGEFVSETFPPAECWQPLQPRIRLIQCKRAVTTITYQIRFSWLFSVHRSVQYVIIECPHNILLAAKIHIELFARPEQPYKQQ